MEACYLAIEMKEKKSVLKTPKNGFIKGGLKLLVERQVKFAKGKDR